MTARNSTIATALGVSPAQITRWRARGMPPDLDAARAWHSAHIRTRRKRSKNGSASEHFSAVAPPGDSVGDPPARSWRERLDRANAQVRERELEVARGEHFSRAEVAATWRRAFSEFRTRMLAVPNAIGARTTPSPTRDKILEAVDEEIRAALLQLSGAGEPR